MLLLRQFFSITTLTCLLLAAAPVSPVDAIPAGTDRQTIRVVMDSNYPPFVFRDSSGRPQGILIDQWRLWVAAIIMLVLGLFVWTRILHKKLDEKTAAHAEELRLNSQRAEELRQSEEQLRMLNLELEQRVAARTAELESALRQTESFAYSISHDLRAPLTGINGFVQILVEDYGPQFPPEVNHHLARISRNVKKMGALIDDILTFSRLSMQPLRLQLVEPAKLVREVMAELRNDEAGREIDLTIGALPPCQADLALLRQVLVNLLSNALKFTRKRTPACIEVGSRREEGNVVYYVKDNGAGFEMAYADKLFGVFQRFHYSEEFEGTGVGLAIVRNIVERHGGRVWAESKPASGTTLYFTLGSGP